MMNIADSTARPCPLCGGERVRGMTTFAADLGFGVVVVRKVTAQQCNQCGEAWVPPAVASRLEAIVDRAREDRHQVEVLDLVG